MSSLRQELNTMGFWDFHRTADDHWQWRYVSENTACCVYSGRFRSRNDCIADAMRHGYLSDRAPLTACENGRSAASVRQDLHAEARMTPSLQRLLT